MTQLEELKNIVLTNEVTGQAFSCVTTKIGYENMLDLNSQIFAGLPAPTGDEVDFAFATGFAKNKTLVGVKLIKRFFGIDESISLNDFDEELLIQVQNLILEIGFLTRIIGVRSLS